MKMCIVVATIDPISLLPLWPLDMLSPPQQAVVVTVTISVFVLGVCWALLLRSLDPPKRKRNPLRLRTSAGIIMAALTTGLVGYFGVLLYPQQREHLRYKLTIAAVFNGQPISGSSVVGIDRTWRRRWNLSWETETFVDGEAALLELSPKAALVAALASSDPYGRGMAERWPYWGEIFEWGSRFRGIGPVQYKWMGAGFEDGPMRNTKNGTPVSSKISLSGRVEPLLFVFYGEREPSEQVRASVESHFRGLKIMDITAEPTDAPVTHGLAARIPWIESEAARSWGAMAGSGHVGAEIFVRHDQKMDTAR